MLDFGLAKLTEADAPMIEAGSGEDATRAETRAASLTDAGTVYWSSEFCISPLVGDLSVSQ